MLRYTTLVIAALTAGATLARPAAAQDHPLGFFITSEGPGDGANLGGLEGADAHCQALAEAVGAGDRSWRAYLSTIPSDAGPAIHARDRIGDGPWYNADGVMVAESVEHLHSDAADLTKQTSKTEGGELVNGRGDSPNMHDIITGTALDGTAFLGDDGYDNCSNWASSSSDGSTRVGHHDRTGGGPNPTSWNSAHNSRGCGQEDLQGTGGNGLFYCFAADPAM